MIQRLLQTKKVLLVPGDIFGIIYRFTSSNVDHGVRRKDGFGKKIRKSHDAFQIVTLLCIGSTVRWPRESLIFEKYRKTRLCV